MNDMKDINVKVLKITKSKMSLASRIDTVCSMFWISTPTQKKAHLLRVLVRAGMCPPAFSFSHPSKLCCGRSLSSPAAMQQGAPSLSNAAQQKPQQSQRSSRPSHDTSAAGTETAAPSTPPVPSSTDSNNTVKWDAEISNEDSMTEKHREQHQQLQERLHSIKENTTEHDGAGEGDDDGGGSVELPGVAATFLITEDFEEGTKLRSACDNCSLKKIKVECIMRD